MTTLTDKMRALQARMDAADRYERLRGLATLGVLSMELPALVIALENLLPYARACVPHPVDVGERNVIGAAEDLLQRIEERMKP